MSQLQLERAADGAAFRLLTTAVAATPVKSEIFVGLALLFFSLVVLLILRYYLPLRSTPAYLLVPVFFALWLPANIILLVPIDLASNAQTDDEATRGIWLPEAILRVSWRVTYWLTFALTWFILPILAEYSDAGYREPKDRFLYSLRQNAQYHVMVFGSGIVGLVYVFVSYGVSVTALKGLVMALAYCWGLVLAIYLMGHGLVAIPRRLLRTASPSRRLRRLQSQAPQLYEKLEEAEMDLEDVELQVAELGRRKAGTALDFRAWIDELHDGASRPEAHPAPGAMAAVEEAARSLPTVITKKYMADLTRRLVRARHARSRYLSEWNRLLQDYSETQTILNSAASQRLEWGPHSGGRGRGGWTGRLTLLTPYTRYLVHYHVVPWTRLVLGVVLAAASVSIVWSELVKAALPSASFVRLSVVHHWTGEKGQVGFAGQLVATLWILYMCAAAFVSITEAKVWRGRALVKRNTAHESAFWYASQVARLSIPLSYNFMTFLSKAVYEKTVFYDFLGRLINLTPLGTWFDYLFPAFLLVPVLATLFGLYGKARRLFGLADRVDAEFIPDYHDDEDAGAGDRSYGAGSWRAGRDLLERELNGTSIRQRHHQAAAAAAAAAAAPGGHRGPIMVVPGGRHTGSGAAAGEAYEDDIESAGATATTPFAVSPSTSGFFRPPAPRAQGGRTRTLGAGAGAGAATRAGPSSGRRQRAYRNNDGGGGGTDGGDAAEEEEENIFQALGHRMKNTIDTIEPPKWFHDIGQGLKKPKWMAGANESSAAPPAGDGNGIRRWFGGSDGRIRL
ncbi:lmbr1 domain containing protein [Niveomyces insectorum RCEF 264]|uniref:Lmbr1 domain containing protein n=1 Tax=Niveomyces insectorum RCEF 264 TaxID=1081102 RepID=A0A162MBI9_9HYPO|nr:lmbr1 domain containing protein [Niveomyces insectorum RCEF 264]